MLEEDKLMARATFRKPSLAARWIQRRSETRIKRIRQFTSNAAEEIGEKTVSFARSIAPVNTGALIQGIHFKIQKGNKNILWLMQRNPGITNPNVWGKQFNYASWMNKTGGVLRKTNRPRVGHDDNGAIMSFPAGKHIYSGDPHYMRTAAAWMRNNSNKIIRAHVQRAIKI